MKRKKALTRPKFVVVFGISFGSGKGQELAWNNPVPVPILHPLKEFVRLDVKGPEVHPSKLCGTVNALEHVNYFQIVERGTFACISVGKELGVALLKGTVRLNGIQTTNQHLG